MSDLRDQPERLLNNGASSDGERDAAALLDRAGAFAEADQLSRERVWRDVARQLPGNEPERPRRFVWAAAMALVLAVVAGAAWRLLWPAPSLARVELTAGAVLSAPSGGSWAAAQAGAALPERSRLKTPEHGQALVKLDRATVLIAARSDVAFESLGPQTFIRLAGGEIISEVEPRRSGEPYVVQTTRYRVTVKGTVFAVRERAPDDVSVSVSRGLVEVKGEGGTWLVAAGRSWNSRDADTIGNDDIRASEHSLLEAAQRPGPRAVVRVEGESELEVSEGGVALGPLPITWSAPAGRYHFVAGPLEGDATAEAGNGALVTLEARAVAAKTEVAAAPVAAPAVQKEIVQAAPDEFVPPEPRPKPVRAKIHHATLHPGAEAKPRAEALPPPVAAPAPAAVAAPAPAQSAAAAPSASTPQTPEIPSAPVKAARARDESVSPPAFAAKDEALKVPAEEAPAAPPAEDAYSKAIALSRAGQFAEAAAAFATVAASHGAHADLALYELGRVEQLKLSHPDRALAAFLRYQREYPHGSLVQEVDLTTIELLLQRHDLDAALEQMTHFLDKHATSERAPEVHLLRGDVRRERGDCKRAIDDYAKATAPAQADDALYFTAWCQQHLGWRDDAAASFGDYLKRFPQGRHSQQARAALPSP